MRDVSKSSVSLRQRTRRWHAALLLGLAGLAGGCGQKGPLTLPGAAKISGDAASAAGSPESAASAAARR